jgi:hypothetical protein
MDEELRSTLQVQLDVIQILTFERIVADTL